jgi:hypothetical protein
LFSVFQGIATRVGGLFSRALSLVNPLSRQGVFGVARRVARAASFMSLPAAGALGAVVKGASDIRGEAGQAMGEGAAAGIPLLGFSRLKNQFAAVGGEAGDAVEVVNKLNEAIADVAANGGNSKFAQAFSDAGLSVTNFDGTLKSGYQVLQEYMAGFADAGATGPGKLEALQRSISQVVGATKAALPLTALLSKAASGDLDKINAQIDRFGVEVGPQQVAAMQAFTEGMSAFKQPLRGIAIELTTVVGPELGQWFNGLANLIAENRDTIVGQPANSLVAS